MDNYADIYCLEKYRDSIVEMEGFGEKSYNNLISAIEKSKNVNLCNFIYALGINNVGLSNAKLLCKKYNNDLEKIMNASADSLCEIDGIGEVIAVSIVKYFNHSHNIELINKALEYIAFVAEESTGSNKLEGKTFVITGDVHNYKNRKELQNFIESMGGKVTGSVSAKTNYLINNDVTSNSSKNKKAKELNIPILSEEDFAELIESL